MRVLTDIWQRPLTGYRALAATLIGAGLMAASANIAVHLPWTPVPFTLQPFVVVLCAMLLGSRLGALTVVEYLAAGLAGAPVFADFKFGPAAFAGPTGGYLIGFVAAAYVIGRLIESSSARSFMSMSFAGLAGIGVIYTFGVAHLSIWCGSQYPGFGVWAIGALPFAALDMVKVAAAALIASGRR